jgi:hypothetical protein
VLEQVLSEISLLCSQRVNHPTTACMLQGMVMPPEVAPTQVIGIPIPNAKLSQPERAALTSKVQNQIRLFSKHACWGLNCTRFGLLPHLRCACSAA